MHIVNEQFIMFVWLWKHCTGPCNTACQTHCYKFFTQIIEQWPKRTSCDHLYWFKNCSKRWHQLHLQCHNWWWTRATLSISRSCHSGSRKIHHGQKQHVKFVLRSCWLIVFISKALSTRNLSLLVNCEWEVLLWCFKVTVWEH